MNKKRICVIGLGLFGTELARSLAEKNDVLAIDIDEALVNRISDHVQRALILDATDYEALSSVVDSDFTDAIVGISEHMEASILCTLNLKKLGVAKVWAKAVNKDHMTVLRAIGADEIIFPERDSAERLAMHLMHDNLVDYIPLTDKYSVMEVTPPHWFNGKTLIELALRKKFDVFVMAVKRAKGDEFEFLPGPDFMIQDGDLMLMVGSEEDLNAIKNASEPFNS